MTKGPCHQIISKCIVDKEKQASRCRNEESRIVRSEQNEHGCVALRWGHQYELVVVTDMRMDIEMDTGCVSMMCFSLALFPGIPAPRSKPPA